MISQACVGNGFGITWKTVYLKTLSHGEDGHTVTSTASCCEIWGEIAIHTLKIATHTLTMHLL